jgi:ligand-binding sensor domain-containing protein
MIGIHQMSTRIASRLAKRSLMRLPAFGLLPRSPILKLIRKTHGCAPSCVLLGLVLTASVLAQSVNVGMTHHTWGLEDGLPDRVIQTIAQTPDGYLWLGTPHGLVRFDGFKFIPFGTEIAPSLHEFGVSCILVAKDGSLWIGSVGGGVTHLNSHFGTHFGTEQGLQALTVRTLYQSGDGTLWAGTDRGLYRLAGADSVSSRS